MNYLAHAYLSFNDPGLLVGNMISDFVKGKKKFEYPPRILTGIELHRAIDCFTDFHPLIKETRSVFRNDYGLYSGAFLDIIFDHFLALDTAKFPGDDLLDFSRKTYNILDEHVLHHPAAFSSPFHYMKIHNWLYNYRYTWGIERSLHGIAHRAKFMHDASRAVQLFEEHYVLFERSYKEFFPALDEYTRTIIASPDFMSTNINS